MVAEDPPAAPRVSASLAPILAVVGESVRMTAPFKAAPRPKISWQKGETPLNNVDRIAFKVFILAVGG